VPGAAVSDRAPRIGLGRDRVEPDRARFRSTAQLVLYLCDYLALSQAQVATRCGVGRPQLSRWINGSAEPTPARLRAALEPLGWRPVITLRPTEAALDEWLARPLDLDALLGYYVLHLLCTVTDAVAEGLDVVVGGEVAAVPQGVPVSTRRLTAIVREEHREAFVRLARGRRHGVGRPVVRHDSQDEQVGWVDPDESIESGPVVARLRVSGSRPPTRLAQVDHPRQAGRELPVVTLDALLGLEHEDPAGLGPGAADAAGRFGDRVGRRSGRRPNR
jgi:hypothetical protein